MGNFIDMTGWKMSEHGVKDSHWTVIKRAENDKRGNTRWLCECDCENKTKSIVLGYNIRNGKSLRCSNCGYKIMGRANSKHGETRTRLYNIWIDIKKRCNNKNRKNYRYYGGRGITVCEEWNNSYKCFRDWAMNNGYTDELTIDRIDVDGNYEPVNCRWVTMKIQNNNTRKNKYITYKNKTYTLSEWSDITGINYGTLADRIYNNWSIEDALTIYPNTKEKINLDFLFKD